MLSPQSESSHLTLFSSFKICYDIHLHIMLWYFLAFLVFLLYIHMLGRREKKTCQNMLVACTGSHSRRLLAFFHPYGASEGHQLMHVRACLCAHLNIRACRSSSTCATVQVKRICCLFHCRLLRFQLHCTI